ncbi:MAG: hypothetical protein ACLQEQ_04465 [Nitrososphaerales archaeon]
MPVLRPFTILAFATPRTSRCYAGPDFWMICVFGSVMIPVCFGVCLVNMKATKEVNQTGTEFIDALMPA